jgi:LPPG:FO 2-phospho-L-lactate transferase
MSENYVRTIIRTDKEELPFQEYFVHQQCQPVVRGIRFEGIEAAQPSREVTSAIRKADVIIFCPSNPLLSLDPILALPNLRRIIAASRVPKIGVSPIVGGAALKGPAAKMMAELHMDISPVGVARHLQDVLTGFVLDYIDEAYQDAVTDLGLRTLVTGTVMRIDADRVRLAQEILEFAGV